MIPQIAERLVKRYSHSEGIIVDPFAGSGTVNLEAMLNGRHSFGFDINPLANLIQHVKTTPLEEEQLSFARDYSQKYIEDITNNKKSDISQPKIKNLDLWFKPNVIYDLCQFRELIDSIDQPEVKNLLSLTFSRTINDVANIDKGDNPYFIRSLKGKKLIAFTPNVQKSFFYNLDSISKNIRDLTKTIKDRKLIEFLPELYLKDSRTWACKEGKINAIITSPPYGEEKNTMSYMRFSKLPLFWLGWTTEDLHNLEKYSLGWDHKDRINNDQLSSKTLENLLIILGKQNEHKRAGEVNLFFQDYNQLLIKTHYWLEKNGHLCIVIGNRSAKGIPVLNDKITIELGKSIGFSHVFTYYRNIPQKVLPKLGDKMALINAESIVILKK